MNCLFGKIKTFYNIPRKIIMIFKQINIGLKYFADIRFGMFLVQIDKQKYTILGNKTSAMYSK